MSSESIDICKWCGKSGANSMFGGKKVKYCDFRCAVASGFYGWVAIFFVFLFCTALMLVFPIFDYIIEEYAVFTTTISSLLAIAIYSSFFVFDVMFAYMLIRGFQLRLQRVP